MRRIERDKQGDMEEREEKRKRWGEEKVRKGEREKEKGEKDSKAPQKYTQVSK